MSTFTVRRHGDLPYAATVADGLGATGLAYLLRSLHKNRIAFTTIAKQVSATQFKTWSVSAAVKPAIALITDDGAGHGGWTVAARAVAWAKTIMIHAATQQVCHYEEAIVAAERSRRGLIIECGDDTLGQWLELVAAARHQPAVFVVMPECEHLVPLVR